MSKGASRHSPSSVKNLDSRLAAPVFDISLEAYAVSSELSGDSPVTSQRSVSAAMAIESISVASKSFPSKVDRCTVPSYARDGARIAWNARALSKAPFDFETRSAEHQHSGNSTSRMLTTSAEEQVSEDEEKAFLPDEAPMPKPAGPAGLSRRFWFSAIVNTSSTATIVSRMRRGDSYPTDTLG